MYYKKLFYKQNFSNHNMAGGFDGMPVNTCSAHVAAHKTLS